MHRRGRDWRQLLILPRRRRLALRLHVYRPGPGVRRMALRIDRASTPGPSKLQSLEGTVGAESMDQLPMLARAQPLEADNPAAWMMRFLSDLRRRGLFELSTQAVRRVRPREHRHGDGQALPPTPARQPLEPHQRVNMWLRRSRRQRSRQDHWRQLTVASHPALVLHVGWRTRSRGRPAKRLELHVAHDAPPVAEAGFESTLLGTVAAVHVDRLPHLAAAVGLDAASAETWVGAFLDLLRRQNIFKPALTSVRRGPLDTATGSDRRLQEAPYLADSFSTDETSEQRRANGAAKQQLSQVSTQEDRGQVSSASRSSADFRAPDGSSEGRTDISSGMVDLTGNDDDPQSRTPTHEAGSMGVAPTPVGSRRTQYKALLKERMAAEKDRWRF